LVSLWETDREVLGRVSDSIAVLKTAPDLGYELFMPRDMVLRIGGISGQYYRVWLSGSKDVWVKRSSVELLPQGRVLQPAKLAMVRLQKAARGSSVNLLLSRPVVYQLFPGADGRALKMVLYDTQADMDWIRYDPSDRLVRDIRWRQTDSRTVELDLALNQPLWGYSTARGSGGLSLSLFAPPSAAAGQPLKGVKVALDAGHSPDFGAVGPRRTLEKDINWQITKRLGTMLEARGAKVLYTRKADEGVGIYQRPARAAGWGADLLVSIHNNASPDGVNPLLNSGYSTYYYQPYSRGLAEAVHSHFQKTLPLQDHGLFYGNLVLCRGTEFPSILVEPAFIIVPREEALLLEGAFQDKIAAAIAAGIKEFLLKTR
jgi:N-acetylmuramoyl-L-alanine amidase